MARQEVNKELDILIGQHLRVAHKEANNIHSEKLQASEQRLKEAVMAGISSGEIKVEDLVDIIVHISVMDRLS